MKKLIITLIVLLSFAVASILYGTYEMGEVEPVETERQKHLPETMPDVVLDPMTGNPLF